MPPALFDALEDYEAVTDWPEADWSDDFSEARGRGRQAPTPQKYTPPPSNRGYVTNSTFQTAMDKIRADVAANRTATVNVGSQVDALSKRTQSEVKALRQQAMRERDDTRNTLQMLAILPLLSAGGTTTVLAPSPDGKDPIPVQVATPPSTTTEILPLLLLGGFGGSSSSGSGSTGGMDSSMLLMVALLAANK
jgi:hypothetical protein